MHFDELDAAFPEYSSTLNTLDTNIKRLSGEDWLIMVVSDHGGDGTQKWRCMLHQPNYIF